ncbi:MAG: glyoxalase [Bdellovibrionota bacterium]
MKALFIFYVKNQEKSKNFYENVLQKKPCLDVPGMTEFLLNGGYYLGLMPEAGIRRLLGEKFPDPSLGTGIPRSELYLRVQNPQDYHERSIKNGGVHISFLEKRDWGDLVAYSLDLDGHVLAFAKSSNGE